ncbi:PsiF family protein [Methylobacterium fujisawaense]
MRRIAATLIAVVLATPALAQTPAAAPAKEPSAAQAAQRDRMTSCNADAGSKNLRGSARKSFMSDCLSGKPTKALTPQQAKMGSCNKDASAKGLKGADRRSFMSTCLKG